jgi:hypothetical protein
LNPRSSYLVVGSQPAKLGGKSRQAGLLNQDLMQPTKHLLV